MVSKDDTVIKIDDVFMSGDNNSQAIDEDMLASTLNHN